MSTVENVYRSTLPRVFKLLERKESKQAYNLLDTLYGELGKNNYQRCGITFHKKIPYQNFVILTDDCKLCFISLLSDSDLDFIKYGRRLEDEEKISVKELAATQLYSSSHNFYTEVITFFTKKLSRVVKKFLVSDTLREIVKIELGRKSSVSMLTAACAKLNL